MRPLIMSASPQGSVFIKENILGIKTTKVVGLEIHTGKLNGQFVDLIEITEEGISPNHHEVLPVDVNPECIVSLGEAYSCKKSLDTGDMVISSGAFFLEPGKAQQLEEARADQKLIDLGLQAAEKFNSDEQLCKVVVGTILLNPGSARTRRKLIPLLKNNIYCIDHNTYPFIPWLAHQTPPFVLIRTVIPVSLKGAQFQITQLKWDMAKRNFWIVKGILEGLKKMRIQEAVGKVDLI